MTERSIQLLTNYLTILSLIVGVTANATTTATHFAVRPVTHYLYTKQNSHHSQVTSLPLAFIPQWTFSLRAFF